MVGVFSLLNVEVVLLVPDHAFIFSSSAFILSSNKKSESETSSRSLLEDVLLKSKLLVSVDIRSLDNLFFGTGDRLPNGLIMLAFFGDVLLLLVLLKFGMCDKPDVTVDANGVPVLLELLITLDV